MWPWLVNDKWQLHTYDQHQASSNEMTDTIQPCSDVQLASIQSYIHPRTSKSVFSWVEFRPGDKGFVGHWYPSSLWKCQGLESWVLHLVYISCSVLPSYHSATNSLSSPGALLLVGTQQGDYFLNTVFLGQLILFECRQNIPYKGKTTPKNFSKIK